MGTSDGTGVRRTRIFLCQILSVMSLTHVHLMALVYKELGSSIAKSCQLCVTNTRTSDGTDVRRTMIFHCQILSVMSLTHVHLMALMYAELGSSIAKSCQLCH